MKTVIAMAFVAAVVTGCATKNTLGPSLPSDKRTPVIVTPESADVIKAHIGKDKVMASVLDAVQDSGNAIVIDQEGYIIDAATGNPWLWQDEAGVQRPLKVRTVVIAKLNSIHNLAQINAQSIEYIVGGYQRDQLPENLKHIALAPTALQLTMTGVQAGADPATPEIVRARAEERAAIFAGLAEYAKARGIAFATKTEALADGGVKLITATGKEIIGRLNGTTVIETGIATAAKATEAIVTKKNGDTETVILPPPAP